MPLLGFAMFCALIYAIVMWPAILAWAAGASALLFVLVCCIACVSHWAESHAQDERRVAHGAEEQEKDRG